LKDNGKKIVFLFFLIFFFISVALCTESSADMVGGYPKKFRFSGLIQLQYRNYSFETSYRGTTYKNEYAHFEQRYNLNLDGYIYHPRLIVFNSAIYFTYLKSLTGVDITARDLTYDLLVTALPYRPISLDLFASREHHFFEAATSILPDRTINHYGARLKVDLAKLQLIRAIRLGYEHWDYTTEGISEKIKTDQYTLNIRGYLSKIRTRYSISSYLTNYSSSDESIDSKFITAVAETGLTKKGIGLFTSFSYADDKYSTGEYIKELNYGADLSFPPGNRFYHEYRYIYDKSEHFYKGSETSNTEDRLNKISYYLFKGSWGYRFSEGLMGTLYLDSGKRNVNDESGKVSGLSAGLSYSKTIAGFNFQSSYRFLMRKDELRDDSKEHTLNIGLTKQVRLGTVYLNYILIKSNSEAKVFEESEPDFFGEDTQKFEIGERTADSLAHTILLGIRGRGFGKLLRRAIWTFESSYYTVESDIKRPIRVYIDEFTQETQFENINRKTKQYNIYGQLFLPIRNTINFYSRATYTFGEIDSINKKNLIIHSRLTYIIFRNLSFSGLWRGRWETIENTPDRTTFDYEALLDYRRGKVLLSLEFYLTAVKQADASSNYRRIFLTFKRFI
jgi:hypothetical protein